MKPEQFEGIIEATAISMAAMSIVREIKRQESLFDLMPDSTTSKAVLGLVVVELGKIMQELTKKREEVDAKIGAEYTVDLLKSITAKDCINYAEGRI